MAKIPVGQGKQLRSVKEGNFLQSSQEFLENANTGRDVTRPRDLYSFLSVGHLPEKETNPRILYQSKSENAVAKNVHFSLANIHSRRKSLDLDPEFVKFFTVGGPKFGEYRPLPSIQASEDCTPDDDTFDIDTSEFENRGPRKSIVDDDQTITIKKTYIFAPSQRLNETPKYKRNVILPKIKPKKNRKEESNSTTQTLYVLDAVNKAEVVQGGERPITQSGEFLFGVRPECVFMTARLGQKNPLLRDNHKTDTTSLEPKVAPGLLDLKDYDGYPDVYWQLRDNTVTQPEDLEADMIDRDLYRLRQISSLKLNTVERTFQASQDPFRKWKSKSGEPIFSPKQQKRSTHKGFKDRSKAMDANSNFLNGKPHLSKLSPLLLSGFNEDDKHDNGLLSPRLALTTQKSLEPVQDPSHDIPKLPLLETPRKDSKEVTPRDSALDSYRRYTEEKNSKENRNLGKVTVQKLHETKGKKDKVAMKTSLVTVDLQSIDQYKNEHRCAPVRQVSNKSIPVITKSTDSSRKASESDKGGAPGETVPEIQQTELDSGSNNNNNISNNNNNINNNSSSRSSSKNNNKDKINSSRAHKANGNISARHKAVAPLSTVLIQPTFYDSSGSHHVAGSTVFSRTDGYLTDATVDTSNLRPLLTSPEAGVSESSSDMNELMQRKVTTPLRALQLQVFSERKDTGPIKIPTGRFSYHPQMPSCRLDLKNYPPTNARQSCGRSNSAGQTMSRGTHFTHSPVSTMPRPSSSQYIKDEGGAIIQTPPTRGSTGGVEVNIRFVGNGEVIVTSSREGRGS